LPKKEAEKIKNKKKEDRDCARIQKLAFRDRYNKEAFLSLFHLIYVFRSLKMLLVDLL